MNPTDIEAFRKFRQATDESASAAYYMFFQMEMTIDDLSVILSLVWPNLIERDGLVLIDGNFDEIDIDNWKSSLDGDRQAIESQLNHVHVSYRQKLWIALPSDYAGTFTSVR
jgi:hypothetical protein